MELRQVLRALRTGWWWCVIGLLLGGGAGLGLTLLSPPVYTSQTQLFVSTTDSASSSDVLQGSQFSQQRVGSYAQLFYGDELLSRVIERLQLDATTEQLADAVTARGVPDTVLLNVAVTDPSPRRAQEITETLATEFRDMVRQLETPEGAELSPVKVTVVDAAEVPEEPSAPKPLWNVSIGLGLGLVVGGATATLVAGLDRSVRDPDEAATLAGAPVIGAILRDDRFARVHAIDRASASPVVEGYRQIRTNLQFVRVDEPPRVIMVSSALPSEGKTTLAINLALALSEAEHRVVLVEADLRRPQVTRYLGLVGGAGLSQVLAGTAQFDDVVQSYGHARMDVLAAGPNPPNPGELLSSAHMGALLGKLRGTYDYVIIDAPPLLPVADASGLAPAVDGVVLSVRHGGTRKEQVRQTVLTLDRVNATTLGLVLNIVPPKADIAQAYGYGYGYDAGRHAEGA